jgi:hypothetical protein
MGGSEWVKMGYVVYDACVVTYDVYDACVFVDINDIA